jgi:hypothetical protein
MKTNHVPSEQQALGLFMSDWPDNMRYATVLKMLREEGEAVVVAEDFQDMLPGQVANAIEAAEKALREEEQRIIERYRSNKGVALQDLIKNAGLDFSDCVSAFAEKGERAKMIGKEMRNHTEEGFVECDDNVVVSDGGDPDGVFVMTWTWVERPKGFKCIA